MASRKRSSSPRFRVGKVSIYLHHGAWWLYYREHGKPIRSKVALTQDDAERIAAQVNAQVTNGSPTLLSFEPITVPELRQQFLDCRLVPRPCRCPALQQRDDGTLNK